jgi:uncharacterized membrane protein YfcA
MKAKTLLFYILSFVSLIVALVLFFKWLDWKFLLPMILGIAAVIFFWLGTRESKKQ